MLDDVQITVPGGGEAFPAGRAVPENPEAYPEYRMFGPLPAYGLYCRHARGLTLDRVAFRTAKPDARPALFGDDVEDLSVSALSGPAPAAPATPLMELRDARRARIRETRSAAPSQPLLRLSGARTADVAIAREQESDAAVLADPEVSASAWRWLR